MRRRKNKKMSIEEIEEFDRITIENRKKSKRAYWAANKERPELKRPGRSSEKYRDDHHIYEDPNYVKPLLGKKYIRFFPSNSKGKDKEILHEESLPYESLDKGKGKAEVEKNNYILWFRILYGIF